MVDTIRKSLFLLLAVTFAFALIPALAFADEAAPEYQKLDELAGKRFAYVNGSVYNLSVQSRLQGTSEDFYPSLSECVAAVEAGKADAAVQLSYCCQLAVNRRPNTVTLLPEPVSSVSQAFFFPHGSELTAKFNETIGRLSQDGTLKKLEEKWVAASRSLGMTCSGATARGLVSFRAEGAARRPEPRNLVLSCGPPRDPSARFARSG